MEKTEERLANQEAEQQTSSKPNTEGRHSEKDERASETCGDITRSNATASEFQEERRKRNVLKHIQIYNGGNFINLAKDINL